MGTAGESQLIGWHPVSWSKEQADQSLRRPEERGDGKTDMGLYRKAGISLPMGSAHLYQSGRYPAREQIDGYPSTKVQNVVTDRSARVSRATVPGPQNFQATISFELINRLSLIPRGCHWGS
jgi:hypothetical protein